eukprot:SM005536S17898  [mRNA]  locus=s5536:81:602:+ [translate_table: standard]
MRVPERWSMAVFILCAVGTAGALGLRVRNEVLRPRLRWPTSSGWAQNVTARLLPCVVPDGRRGTVVPSSSIRALYLLNRDVCGWRWAEAGLLLTSADKKARQAAESLETLDDKLQRLDKEAG